MSSLKNRYSQVIENGSGFGRIFLLILMSSIIGYSQVYNPQQGTPQNPSYPNQSYGGFDNGYDNNYSSNSPFKTEVGRLDASVYRDGKDPLPLMEVPRLNQGDVLKIKMANEPVNGIMPDQSNMDWTLLVAFINPSKGSDRTNTVSEEIRLRESGWYKDYFFKVPYDSQPIIFLYPKGNYRTKILDLIQKKPDQMRQMGEKVIEISGAYGQISSFLNQLQNMMYKNSYRYGGYYGGGYGGYGGYGNGMGNSKGADSYVEQSIEGLAKSFNLQLPSCWNNSSYSPIAVRAQCVSKNIRLEDLNFSVTQMLLQGGLFAVNQLMQAYPQLSKWIALAAVAVDFFMKMTGRVGIKIIPAIVSSPDNPLYFQNGYGQFQNSPQTYGQQMPVQNNFAQGGNNSTSSGNSGRVSLYANSQPTTREYVTVYAFVPHKWQANAEPDIYSIYTPQMNEPCIHAGRNILRNSDLRLEWLADTFTRDFKLLLSDKNGWKKEFELKKNLGLNSWEAELSKEEVAMLPKTSVPFDAKITGKRGFTDISSETFPMPISNGGTWEAEIKPAGETKKIVTLRKIAGESKCSQNIIFKPGTGQQVIFPIVRDNSFLKFSEDGNTITFEMDSANPQISTGDAVDIQLFGGDTISVVVRP